MVSSAVPCADKAAGVAGAQRCSAAAVGAGGAAPPFSFCSSVHDGLLPDSSDKSRVRYNEAPTEFENSCRAKETSSEGMLCMAAAAAAAAAAALKLVLVVRFKIIGIRHAAEQGVPPSVPSRQQWGFQTGLSESGG